jgi:hypothetical protein
VVVQERAQQQPEPVRELQPGQRQREPEPPERWVQPPEPLNSQAPPQVQPREQSSQAQPPVQAQPQGPVQASNSCIRPTLWSPEKLSLPKNSEIAYAWFSPLRGFLEATYSYRVVSRNRVRHPAQSFLPAADRLPIPNTKSIIANIQWIAPATPPHLAGAFATP